MTGFLKKESVEFCVYRVEASDKARKQMNSFPHLLAYVCEHISSSSDECCCCHCFLETVRFPTQDKSETLSSKCHFYGLAKI